MAPGETPEQSMKRALKEELGIFVEFNFVGEDKHSGIPLPIFTAKFDCTFYPNLHEIEETRFRII